MLAPCRPILSRPTIFPSRSAKPKRKKALRRADAAGRRAIAGLLGLCVAVLAGWILFVDEPFGGEPMVIVSADTRASPQATKCGEPASARKPDAVAPPTAALADGGGRPGQTVTIIDGSTGKRQEVTVAPTGAPPSTAQKKVNLKADAKTRHAGSIRAADETSRHGMIPKIAPDGARPAEIYARPVKAAGEPRRPPRIAIVIEGLGVGANGTSEALAKLPPGVTFAFAPYGTDLERWVARARGEGHEVLLQVGMEPFDYPDNDPGPQTLLTSASAEQNIDRLHWFMSRFQGYVGVTSLMGARFTANDQAFAPVLREIGKRGLDLFRRRLLAAQPRGARFPAPTTRPSPSADAVLDAVPTARRDRQRAGAAGSDRAQPRRRDRHRERAAGYDRPHRPMGEGRRGARHHAGAGQRGRERRRNRAKRRIGARIVRARNP